MEGFSPFGVQIYQPTLSRTDTFYRDENTAPWQAMHQVSSPLDDEDPFADKYQGALREEPATEPMVPAYYMYPHQGSNVPALADISNGQSFTHKEKRLWAGHTATLERLALQEGKPKFAAMLNEVLRSERVSLEELVTGCFEWTPSQSVQDVWRWVGVNGFYLRWSNRQRTEFKGMLKLLSSEMRRDSGLRGDALVSKCQCLLKTRGGIENIEVSVIGHARFRFLPVAYSKPQHRRRDFGGHDQWGIDIFYPEYWVEEDRAGRGKEAGKGADAAVSGEARSFRQRGKEWECSILVGDGEDSAGRRTVEEVLGSILKDE